MAAHRLQPLKRNPDDTVHGRVGRLEEADHGVIFLVVVLGFFADAVLRMEGGAQLPAEPPRGVTAHDRLGLAEFEIPAPRGQRVPPARRVLDVGKQFSDRADHAPALVAVADRDGNGQLDRAPDQRIPAERLVVRRGDVARR